MGVSGQRHAPAALYPRGKDLWYPLYRRLGEPQSRSGHRGYRKEKHFLCRGSNLNRPVVQSVARHYTDGDTWVTVSRVDSVWISNSVLRVLPEKLTDSWLVKRFPYLSWKPKVHYHVHKIPPAVPILNHMNPVHTLASYLFKTHFNIILPFMPMPPMWATCPAQLVLIHLVFVVTYSGECSVPSVRHW
jgi:hypothetical protein